ncbi:hypothetical protein ACFLTT_00110 [Chloroflexota bacterium]
MEKYFPAYVYPNIAMCLKMHQGVGATILLCCAIDTLANYADASPSVTGNKKRFKAFISSYFPKQYDPEQFYLFVRCGLVHSFNMENKYIVLCSKEVWAQKLHLSKPDGFNRVIINPYVLFRHTHKALKQFIDALLLDKTMTRAFSKKYKLRPLMKQHIRIPKAWKKIYPGISSKAHNRIAIT